MKIKKKWSFISHRLERCCKSFNIEFGGEGGSASEHDFDTWSFFSLAPESKALLNVLFRRCFTVTLIQFLLLDLLTLCCVMLVATVASGVVSTTVPV